jgi:hypothetical protein
MRGNVVLAAAVFAIGVVVASVVLVLGGRMVADRAMTRFETAVEDHAKSVERAGVPINAGLRDVAGAFDRPAAAIDRAGERISHPQLQGPVTVDQPLLIRGVRDDGALPVNAKLAK